MKKSITVKINMKGVNKKIEEIAKKKYPPIYTTQEPNESNLSYSPPQKIYTSDGSVFVTANKNVFYSQPKEDIPFGYHKIKCHYCDKVIAIPMGYSHCPECGKTVYADKNTVFLL